ncbi:MAG: hypothetical protein NVS3B3_23960 [Aquirhabdus sp.]
MTDRLNLSTPSGKDHSDTVINALEAANDNKRIKELEKNIADLEKLKSEQDKSRQKNASTAPEKKTGSNKIGARKDASFKAMSTAPSFNKTPVGSATPVLPYPTTQDLSNSATTASTVKFNRKPAYTLNHTTQHNGKGDDAGTAKGVKSNTVNGEVKPTKGSSTVRIEGKQVVRQGDPNTMNGGNNPGIYVTTQTPSDTPPKDAAKTSNPPITPETPKEQSTIAKWWDKTKSEMGAAIDHPIEGIKGAAKGIANIPSELAEMLAKGSALQSAGEMEQAAAMQSLFGQTESASRLAQSAEQVRQGAQQIEVPKFSMNNPAQAGGDKISTAIQLLAGGAGIVKSGAKGLTALGKVGTGLETQVAKGALEGEQALSNAAKAASTTDAAKTADAVADAGKAETAATVPKPETPKPAGDGVKVKAKDGAWKNAPNRDKWVKRGGKIEDHPDGSVTYTNKEGVSVTYDSKGYPDFSPHLDHPSGIKEIKVEGLQGDHYYDFKKANEAANLPYGGKSPPGYTWHHLEDGKSMQLVPSSIHKQFTHAGGASVLTGG